MRIGWGRTDAWGLDPDDEIVNRAMGEDDSTGTTMPDELGVALTKENRVSEDINGGACATEGGRIIGS